MRYILLALIVVIIVLGAMLLTVGISITDDLHQIINILQ